MLTGNKDVDFIILNQLSDYDLGKIGQINRKAQELCNDDYFWFNRSQKYLNPDKLKKAKNFLEFTSYKELYKFLGSKNALEFFYDHFEFYNNNVKNYYEESSLVFGYEDTIKYIFSKIKYPIWVNSREYEKYIKRCHFPGYSSRGLSIYKEEEKKFTENFLIYMHNITYSLLPDINEFFKS